ncbi:hypothetical protein D9613_009759 [Agrocybe pediades]|uniref:Uncharacterized protein n=1 Tax=Agrocybe pediades TaxID=84607 RepID=A0A8H4QYV6_9AGAR|nr:hypothetical protein D9613_009759 [Agrocybe pediades]
MEDPQSSQLYRYNGMGLLVRAALCETAEFDRTESVLQLYAHSMETRVHGQWEKSLTTSLER